MQPSASSAAVPKLYSSAPSSGDRADASLGDELDGNGCERVDLLEVVDELREVLDGIDVVVWRGRDQRDPLLGVPEPRDLGGRLVTRKLATFAGLRPLRHFDLELISKDAVLGRNPEASRGDLLDARVAVDRETTGAISGRVLAALARVALPTQPVHRDRNRLVRLRGDRAVRHGTG